MRFTLGAVVHPLFCCSMCTSEDGSFCAAQLALVTRLRVLQASPPRTGAFRANG